MNIPLWIVQVALAWFCIAGGVFQLFKFDQLQKGVAAMRELPQGLWAFFGAFGCLAGLALILPGALGVLPVLTPVAAAAIAVQSVVISALYTRYGDSSPRMYSLAMVALAAFVSYGRFTLAPL
jgi:hypothetical protein